MPDAVIKKLKFKRVPPFLKTFAADIETAVNERTPIAGLGIDIVADPNGAKFETEEAVAEDAAKRGGGGPMGGGSTADIYGSLNGAPAIFHLKQSTPPTVPPPLE